MRDICIYFRTFFVLCGQIYILHRENVSLIPSRQIKPCGLRSLILYLVYASPCFPYTMKLITGSIQKYTEKKADIHDLLKSLYSQNVTFGIAQIYREINAMNIFLLHCSSCFTGSSWLKQISLGAQSPRSPYRDDLLGCLLLSLCKQLPPVFLHQCPLSL